MRKFIYIFLVIVAVGGFFLAKTQRSPDDFREESEIYRTDHTSSLEDLGPRSREIKSNSFDEITELYKSHLKNLDRGLEGGVNTETHLSRIVEQIDQNNYSQIWELIKMCPPGRGLDKLFESVFIKKMFENGLGQQAFEIVNSSLGPGKDKIGLLKRVFAEGGISPQVVSQWIDQLKFQDEIDGAVVGISESLAGESTPLRIYEFLDSDNEILKSAAIESLAIFSISNINQDGVSFSDKVSIAFEIIENLNDSDRGRALSAMVLTSAFLEPLNLKKQLESQFGPNFYERLEKKARSNLFWEMSKADPEKTVEFLAGSNVGSDELELPFKGWLDADVKEAVGWYQKNETTLRSATRDEFLRQVVDLSLKSSEFETAWDWVDKVTDPYLAISLKAKITEKENQKN